MSLNLAILRSELIDMPLIFALLLFECTKTALELADEVQNLFGAQRLDRDGPGRIRRVLPWYRR